MELKPADLEFNYKHAYPNQAIPEAYERLLQDALQGDAALFMRSDEIERAWEIMDPFIAVAQDASLPRPQEYKPGVRNPPGADEFLRSRGCEWIDMRSDRKDCK